MNTAFSENGVTFLFSLEMLSIKTIGEILYSLVSSVAEQAERTLPKISIISKTLQMKVVEN